MTRSRPLARGDVVLVPFPFTDLSSHQVRPALIVGRPIGADVIVVFATSIPQAQPSRSVCVVGPGHSEFDATGLRLASTVRLDKLATLQRKLVVRRLGVIGPRIAADVTRGLRYVFDI